MNRELISSLEQLWSSKPLDLEAKQVHWDRRASEFNKHGKNERVSQIIAYLVSKGALQENDKVLDIGCGTGRYAMAFAEQGANVTGIDISENMIRYARENATGVTSNPPVFDVVAWEHIDIDEKGWKDAFSLVTAIMTPAISSKKELDKMIKASSQFCIMSSHLDKREAVKEAIEKDVLSRKEKGNPFGHSIYCSFNILWQYGIHPELTYYQMEKEVKRTIDEAYEYYCNVLSDKQALSALEKSKIFTYLKQLSKDGDVIDKFSSKTGWLFWENIKGGMK